MRASLNVQQRLNLGLGAVETSLLHATGLTLWGLDRPGGGAEWGHGGLAACMPGLPGDAPVPILNLVQPCTPDEDGAWRREAVPCRISGTLPATVAWYQV